MAINERTNVKIFPTAIATDVLFYVSLDSNVPKNQAPVYGTVFNTCFPHTEDFPNHRLVFVSPSDRDGKQKWYFAADRENQDTYNWEFSQADIGGTKFNFVKRTYVVRRSAESFTSPAQGDAMPNVPEGMFGSGFVLGGRSQTKAIEELNGLYVAEVREYVQKKTITDIQTDRIFGVGVATTTTLYYRGEIVTGSSSVESLFATPTNAFWGLQADGTHRDGRQLSDNWFAVIATGSRDAAILAYRLAVPSTVNLALPDVLVSASIVWNVAGNNGSFDSEWGGVSAWEGEVNAALSGNEQASAEGAASVQPEFSPIIKQYLGRDIPSVAYFFYTKATNGVVTSSDFLTRLSAVSGSAITSWPTFNPEAHTVVLKGMKVGVSAKASGSAAMSANVSPKSETTAQFSNEKNQGSGVSYDVATSTTVVRIPPTIHGGISFSGDTTKTQAVSAECNVGWPVGTVSPATSVLGHSVVIPEVAATATASMDATGSVTPTMLSATEPAVIPTSGYYVKDTKISPYEDGWVQCYAEVFNAADISA